MAYVCPELPLTAKDSLFHSHFEWKVLPAKSVNKGCCSLQANTLQPPHIWALREFRLEPGCLPSSHQTLKPHPKEASWRDSRWERTRHWPKRAEVHSNFREPRLLHLSIYRKVLNSLTWDIWFSLINSNRLMFQLSGLCFKNSYISWLLPCLFRAIPYNYLRGCVLGLIPWFCRWIKHNSQLLGWAFLQSTHSIYSVFFIGSQQIPELTKK